MKKPEWFELADSDGPKPRPAVKSGFRTLAFSIPLLAISVGVVAAQTNNESPAVAVASAAPSVTQSVTPSLTSAGTPAKAFIGTPPLPPTGGDDDDEDDDEDDDDEEDDEEDDD